MTVSEAATPEPLDRKVRTEAIVRMTSALLGVLPHPVSSAHAIELKRLARDVADECIDAFLIAVDGGVKA